MAANLFMAATALALFCFSATTALAQGPTYQLGRTPTQDEIKAWDISVGPEGKELPPGSGTATEGAKIYAQKCAACHGASGTEEAMREIMSKGRLVGGKVIGLVGGKDTLTTTRPLRTIGSYYPFATTLWDYISRAMPINQEGSLKAEEVYAVTAFLLSENGIIQENEVIDAKSLPKIQMPNRNGFFPAEPAWKPGYYQPYFSPQPVPRTKKP